MRMRRPCSPTNRLPTTVSMMRRGPACATRRRARTTGSTTPTASRTVSRGRSRPARTPRSRQTERRTRRRARAAARSSARQTSLSRAGSRPRPRQIRSLSISASRARARWPASVHRQRQPATRCVAGSTTRLDSTPTTATSPLMPARSASMSSMASGITSSAAIPPLAGARRPSIWTGSCSSPAPSTPGRRHQ